MKQKQLPLWLTRHWRAKAGLFLLATVLWFLVVTMKTYEQLIWVPVRVIGLKPGKMVVADLPDYAEVKFSATGRELIRMSYFNRPYLALDLSTINYYYTFNLTPEMVIVPGGLKARAIDVVQPDSIAIVLKDRNTVMLPVLPNVKVNLAPGYVLSGRVTVSPAQVRVSGPKGQIESVRGVATEDLVLDDVKSNLELEADLVPPLPGAFNITPARVKIAVRVEKLGERTFVGVAIRPVNPPRGREIIVDPVVVNVRATGSSSLLSGLSADDFQAYVDYHDLDPSGGGKVPVHINLPDGVADAKATPATAKMFVRRR